MTAFGSLAWPLYWASLGVLASVAILQWVVRARPLAVPALVTGGVSLSLAIAARWAATGRPPVLGTFENTLVAAWCIVVVALATTAYSPFKDRTRLSRLLVPWAPAFLAFGLFFERQPMRVEAAGRSIVGYVHAFAGWLDFAVLLAATLAAVATFASRDVDAEPEWDDMTARFLGLGFALLTLTMVSGSLYSFMLFSEWYRWQVVETFSAATWLAYGIVLHARMLFGWRGKRLAAAVLAVVPLMVAAFWIWSLYPDTYHYFERVLSGR